MWCSPAARAIPSRATTCVSPGRPGRPCASPVRSAAHATRCAPPLPDPALHALRALDRAADHPAAYRHADAVAAREGRPARLYLQPPPLHRVPQRTDLLEYAVAHRLDVAAVDVPHPADRLPHRLLHRQACRPAL